MRALLLVLLLSLPGLAHAEVVDRVIYVVEQQVLLQSDVRLDEALAPLDTSPSPFWDRPGVRPEQRVVDAAVLRHLAGSISLYQPSDATVRRRVEALRGQFVDRTTWRTFLEGQGLDEASLPGVLRRRLLVERYLARNVRADPSDREAWWTAVDALLAEVRPTLRIRYVEPRGGEP